MTDTMFDDAGRLVAEGAFDAAEAQLRRLLDLAPEHGPARYYLGQLLLERGEAQEAADCFIRVLQLDPHDKEALRGLWRAYETLGALSLLVDVLESLLAERPADEDYRSLLAAARAAGAAPAGDASDCPAFPAEAFAREPDARFRALLDVASTQLQAGMQEAAVTTLGRLATTTAYADGAVVQALSDVYRQAQDIPALKELWKRVAVAALERGDLDGFLQHAYTSIYAEQMFAREANYRYATIDEDLHALLGLAARAHPLAGWVAQHRGHEAPGSRRLRVGFVLEGLSQLQAPLRLYLPLVEHHDPDRFELFVYSRYPLDGPLAEKERYRDTAAFLAGCGARMRTPDRLYAPTQQVELLARQIVADEVDVLVFQTLYFVPVYNFLSHLRPAPVQALVEHQQPEHARAIDLVFTLRKAALESAVAAEPFPILHLKPPAGEALDRTAFGIPADAVVLASANREVRYRQDAFWKEMIVLLERHPQAYFLAVGLSDARPFLAGHEHLAPRVVTPGFRADVMECLAAADVYVDLFPSGGGSSLIEAMTAGLPVACFDQDYATPYRVDSQTGSEFVGEPSMLVPAGDVARWHHLMDGLIRDRDDRLGRGAAVRRQAHRFEPAHVAASFFDTLHDAFSRRAQPERAPGTL